jgi:hypothetical protein
MNNETKLKGQLIELRGKGWSYEKMSRHLGIDRLVLLRWGMIYKDCIDAEREINRSTLEEIRRLRSQTLDLEPIQQESHFYNLPGESRISTTQTRGPRSNRRVPITTTPKRGRRRQSKIANRKSKIVAGVRKLARSPLVRAAIRYAVFKH